MNKKQNVLTRRSFRSHFGYTVLFFGYYRLRIDIINIDVTISK